MQCIVHGIEAGAKRLRVRKAAVDCADCIRACLLVHPQAAVTSKEAAGAAASAAAEKAAAAGTAVASAAAAAAPVVQETVGEAMAMVSVLWLLWLLSLLCCFMW